MASNKMIIEMIHKYLPNWCGNDDDIKNLYDEIHFRVDEIEDPATHIKACIDYALNKGNGNPIGIAFLINENDDCNIWEYI